MFRAVLLGLLLSSGAALAADPPPAPPAAPSAAPAEPPAIVIPAAILPPERALIRLEVLLDRAHFSPGVIDGKDGANLKLALSSYAAANGLKVDATPATVTDKLVAADDDATVTRYTITAADVAGPFVAHLPTDMAELAKLASPAYSGPVEELAERFHMDDALLQALNPGADFGTAGTEVTVAAVGKSKLGAPVTRIEVDKTANSVRAFDGKRLLAVYPATVGSTERPAPSGTWKVRTVATHATYTFDPKRLTFGKAGEGKLTIKAGPNNPIGTTWIDLTKDTYGIHGTPDPRLIGKRASHGCVRLTNWDVEQLAHAVKAGATVEFTGTEQKAKT
jgi:lipoprotein-anchoring transpeptidase ErfK/SrfK